MKDISPHLCTTKGTSLTGDTATSTWISRLAMISWEADANHHADFEDDLLGKSIPETSSPTCWSLVVGPQNIYLKHRTPGGMTGCLGPRLWICFSPLFFLQDVSEQCLDTIYTHELRVVVSINPNFHVWYVYFRTCKIKMNQMEVNIPHMDGMGNWCCSPNMFKKSQMYHGQS